MQIEGSAILVTGANRGIGRALVDAALRSGAARVYAGTRVPFEHSDQRVLPLQIDVTDARQVVEAAARVKQLDILINNAGIAQYDDLSDPAALQAHLAVNLFGTYGVTQAFLPALERAGGALVNNVSMMALAPFPVTPAYAVSKAAGEMLAGVYAQAHGLQIVRARPFNHAGPGQLPIFIVSSLAQQAARARLEHLSRLRIVTGNPDTRRDFTDVRDVVRAYRLLAAPEVPLGVYNVSSGTSISAAEHVANIAELIAPIEVEHVVDPSRVRANEVMDHRGSFARLHAATGWEPRIPLRQTMADTIAWWESELAELAPDGPRR